MNSYYEKMLATGEVKCIDEEVPFEIPQGWEWERLGNITTIKGGKRIPVGMKLTIENTGHKYIRVADMKNHSVKSDDIHYISDDIYEIIKAYYISKDDLYITVAGTIGNVGVVPEEFDNANLTENADKIEIYSLCKRYLLYALLSEVVQEQVRECTTKVGQPKLAIVRIQKFLIPIAPLADQRRISDRIDVLLPIVDKYDFLFSKLGKLNNSINEVLKKSILQEAIQGRLVPQIAGEGTANKLLEQIKEEKKQLVNDGKLKKYALNDSVIFKGDDNKYYGQIGSEVTEIELPFDFPSTWSIARLNAVCQLTDGLKTTGKQCLLDAKYLRGKSPETIVEQGKLVYKGDNIMLVDGENSGEVFIVPQDGYMGSTFKQLWISSSMYEPYVLAFIQFYKETLRNSKKGAAIPHLNKKLFYGLIIGIPPLQEQRRIVQKIEQSSKLLR